MSSLSKNSSNSSLESLLNNGLETLQLSLNPQQISQLLNYVALLEKWNKTYNLTAIRNPQDMLTEHVLDGLSIVNYLDRKKIIDVGTGAGIPGLICAIACPDKLFTLLDSNGKKTRFLTQVGFELGLKNIKILNQRVEDCQEKFEIITSRAFTSLTQMVVSCQHLLDQDHHGYFLAMKGPSVDQEIEALKKFQRTEQSFSIQSIEKIITLLSIIEQAGETDPKTRHCLLKVCC